MGLKVFFSAREGHEINLPPHLKLSNWQIGAPENQLTFHSYFLTNKDNLEPEQYFTSRVPTLNAGGALCWDGPLRWGGALGWAGVQSQCPTHVPAPDYYPHLTSFPLKT